jgi:hypothetical protein
LDFVVEAGAARFRVRWFDDGRFTLGRSNGDAWTLLGRGHLHVDNVLLPDDLGLSDAERHRLRVEILARVLQWGGVQDAGARARDATTDAVDSEGGTRKPG